MTDGFDMWNALGGKKPDSPRRELNPRIPIVQPVT